MSNQLRIYQQPDHPFYGPARRLHVMLMQLTADVGYDSFDQRFTEHCKRSWDDLLAFFLQDFNEPGSQRTVMLLAMKLTKYD